MNCKDCGLQVSASARSCPSCGAPVRRTRATTKIVAALIAATAVVAVCSGPNRPAAPTVSRYERCPAIAPASLWLPKGHDESVRADFEAKAHWLNAQGQCVLDGSWGESMRKYYYSVRPIGEKNAKHVRFTRDELRAGR